MARLFTAIAFLSLCLPGFADPVAVSFYDSSAFQHALTALDKSIQLETDTFAGAHTSLPGVTVSSDVNFWGYDVGAGSGHFVAGAYTESTGKYTQTVWQFDHPIYSFSGNWQLGNVNAGLEIDAVSESGTENFFLPDGLVPAHSWYSASNQWSGFWGFVSTVPVNAVIIRSGDEGFFNGGGQDYRFSDMQVAALAPEPGSIALAVLGLGLMGAGAVRRSRKAEPRCAAG